MIKQFLEYLQNNDKSQNTINGYALELRLFTEWFNSTNEKEMTPNIITPLDIKQYRQHLERRKLRPGTINHKLIAISQYLAWCEAHGIISRNPAKGIKLAKQAIQAAPKWLTRQETYAILRLVDEQIQIAESRSNIPTLIVNLRNRAMINLMLHAGLRVSELVSLQRDDIEIGERKGKVIIRHGKGNKYREVPLNKDAREALKAWFPHAPETGYLFIHNGQPLQRRTVNFHLEQLGRLAKLSEKLTPHVLRHTFGKNLVDLGEPLDRVAILMGHGDVNTTKIYTTPSQADLQAAVDKISWLD